jgi:high-affinity Fe2+/Pb2+ permease
MAAGLFSYSIHELQEATETYEHVAWELKCCNPDKNYFWGIMKTLFGWRSKATVGTTVGYFVYWLVIGLLVLFLLYKEKRSAAESELPNNEKAEKNEKDEKDAAVMA